MKILDRIDTLEYIKSIIPTRRLVISRYSDGEYLMMNRLNNNTNDSFDILSDLLKKSIKYKNQLVCINYLKPHNINDLWCAVQNYLKTVGEQSLYGCCNWNIYDFQNGNEVLPFLFSNKTLIVTGHVEESKRAFEKYNNISIYQMYKENASSTYEEDKKLLIEAVNKYKFNNIIFACGPIGKVLLTDLENVCDSNLIDIGSLLNAIINEYSDINKPLINQWTMSWAKNTDIKSNADMFFSKLG